MVGIEALVTPRDEQFEPVVKDALRMLEAALTSGFHWRFQLKITGA